MKVLVTGGSGFLGGAVCRLLVARGDEVTSLARGEAPALAALGVRHELGDITELEPVLGACKGMDAVIHVAGKAGDWGTLEDYYAANVAGTDNVIAACFMSGVRRLVYTSTPSVVHVGSDIEGGNESLPYARRFSSHYPRTKALAEQRVLKANGPDLATVALRPHLIFGPGDRQLFPRIVQRRRAGRLRFIAPGGKRIDVTYIDNAAQAHLDALDRVAPGAACAGRAYFISQGQPVVLEQIVNQMLQVAGLPPEQRHLSQRNARLLAGLLETVWRTLRLSSDPPLTRFLVEQLSTSHWFDISAARRDLGYQPKATIGEGLARLSEWWIREGRGPGAR
jgi:nucleoside-diphosphate-sugar epimerase